MEPLRRSYLVEQTAGHLRERLRDMPAGTKIQGVIRLAEQLGVSKTTVRSALRMLEADGLLSLSDDGFSRIVNEHAIPNPRVFRIGILLYDALASENSTSQQLLLDLQDQLEKAGFVCFLSSFSQVELRHDAKRISRCVVKTPADAWVVVAGSYELLGWFVEQRIPCIAIAGRRRTYPIAAVSPDTLGSFLKVTRTLIGLGHRRIVFLCRKQLRLPEPGHVVKAFMEEMSAHGIPVSDYNVPDWEETREGMKTLLNSLFKVTPPTAIIIANIQVIPALLLFLANRRLTVPAHISLVASDDDPSFEWCDPEFSRIRWNSAPAIRRIVRWATAVHCGREDLKQVVYPSEFVEGGTIGPAPKV